MVQLKTFPRLVLGFCMLLLACAQVKPAIAQSDAHFVVRNEIVQSNLQPFTATINEIGNGSRLSPHSGFEPLVFRTMLKTTQAAENRIIAPPAIISDHDSWSTGALDGADVEVLRIENGAFRTVRHDRVANGGHQASGWIKVSPQQRMVAPDNHTFEFAFANFNRPGVPYYFTVRAVDRNGGLSSSATHVEVMAPEAFPQRKPRVENTFIKAEISASEGRLEAPNDLRAELTSTGVVHLTWSPVSRAAGYVVYRSDTPPDMHHGYYLELEGSGPSILAGDLVILRTKFYESDRTARLTNRVWNANVPGRPFRNPLLGWVDDTDENTWRLVPHEPNTIVDQPGETFLRMNLVSSQREMIGQWNHAGLDQDWYVVLNPDRRYRVDVWMRSPTTTTVNFQVIGFYGDDPHRIDPIRFTLTPEWQRFSATFDIPAVHPGSNAGQTRLRLKGPGTIDIDNFRVYADDTPYLAFDNEDIARLEASGMGHLRTHAFIKTGQKTYDLAELTNPGGVSNTAGGNTLPQTLNEIARVGMDPWLQIEPHFTREEWLGFAEYLAAPPGASDRPWAAKREAQGHGPWVDQFDSILFEIGNETWNRLFEPWTFSRMTDAATGVKYSAGEVYGLYQEYVLSILRESPHWPVLSEKLVPVLGGWARTEYGHKAASVSPNSPLLTHAGYNGGWDENAGPARPDAQGLFTVLTHNLQTTQQRAERDSSAARQISQARGTPLSIGIYEAGPGYALNGLNGSRVSEEQAALQELAMKSVAAGTATLDAFLMRAYYGQVLQNFFTYGSGQRWTSHARWNKGGQTYPAWDLLSFFNNIARGDMLAVDTMKVPRVDLQASRNRVAVEGAPLIAAYATRAGERLTLIVISRRVPGLPTAGDGNTSVTVDLPINGAERLIQISQSGTWLSHNADQQGSRLEGYELDIPSTLPRLEISEIPPGETLIYVFEGVR